MRILYDHQVFSLQDFGGVSRYYYELLRYLSGVPGVRAELFLGISGSRYPFRQLPSPQIRVTQLGAVLPANNLRFIANECISSCVLPFRERFDIYHPTHYRIMAAVRARRIIAVIHDCTHETFPSEFRHASKIMRYKSALCARADVIICVSHATRNDLVNFYNVDKGKVRVIHQGLTRLPRGQGGANELAKYRRGDYVLYVGARGGYKNFRGCLRAFRHSGLYRSLDLLLVGGGPLTTEEKGLIDKLELAGNVIRIPAISDAGLGEAYAGARLFVYPSLSEGFGLLPLEAMTFRCPVAASNRSSIPEVCGDAPFYFDPDDEGSFQRALLDAAFDESARKEAADRGARIAEKYSWEKNAQQTLQVYRECQ
jgi:glycosyltransferase involved in cell wall biosynthesis